MVRTTLYCRFFSLSNFLYFFLSGPLPKSNDGEREYLIYWRGRGEKEHTGDNKYQFGEGLSCLGHPFLQ